MGLKKKIPIFQTHCDFPYLSFNLVIHYIFSRLFPEIWITTPPWFLHKNALNLDTKSDTGWRVTLGY